MAKPYELNGNVFLLQNKEYNHANLVQFKAENKKTNLGSYEQGTYDDQLWLLEEEPKHKGYYYIKNKRHNWRICKSGKDREDVWCYGGNHFDDQLWRFEHDGDNYYRIYNYSYPNDKLTKFGSGNDRIGSYDGANYDDQVWKLIPWYEVKESDIKSNILFDCDNRTGSAAFKKTVTVTQGLKLTNSSSLSSTLGIENSLTAAANYGIASAEMTSTITASLSASINSSSEETWSQTETITFSAPAGKNYRVKQIECPFNSAYEPDSMTLGCSYEIQETDGEFEDY